MSQPTILTDPRLEALRRRNFQVCGPRGIWPLDAVGMPPPGIDFLAAVPEAREAWVPASKAKAKAKSKAKAKKGGASPSPDGQFVSSAYPDLVDLHRRALQEPGFTLPVAATGASTHPAVFVPGHIWGEFAKEYQQAVEEGGRPPRTTGPQPADVMVILKAPLPSDVEALRHLTSAQGDVFKDILRRKYMLSDARHWYVTSVVKFLPPGNSVRAGWIKDCLPLLHAELRMVRPKYILCVGADAYKALYPRAKITDAAGCVLSYTFPVAATDKGRQTHTARVMAVGSLSEAVGDISKARITENAMGRFRNLINGADIKDVEDDVEHLVIRTIPELSDLIVRMRAETDHLPRAERLVAWDAEWQGDHPANKGAYLRTVQVSWAHKKAACLVICDVTGEQVFVDEHGNPAVELAGETLTDFMEGKRAVGSFLTADMPWLDYHGFHALKHCRVSTSVTGGDGAVREGWTAVRAGHTWLDVAIMQHSINETSQLGLEILSSWYTECPRYDLPLEAAKREYCKRKGIKLSQLEGYGELEDVVLIPYANYDADTTRRIAVALLPLMEKDDLGLQSWKPLWRGLLAQQVIMTIKENGVAVDRERVERLFDSFYNGRTAIEARIKADVGWPHFNMRSIQHVKEYLFGHELNGRLSPEGDFERLFPEGCRSLELTPLTDTSKPPRQWLDLMQRGLDRSASPSTNKDVLAILAVEQKHVAGELQTMLDSRYIDQVIKTFLRPPNVSGGEWEQDEDGDYVFESGIASFIDDDGRVRTRFRPTAETGRWKSSDPNLQNVTKKREKDYKRILGDTYVGPLRSVFVAAPGKVLVEFDYKGAELFGVAVLANDEKMIDHCRRSNYDDTGYDENGVKVKGGKRPHPDYYDIHSNVTVLAFNLDCEPTKEGLGKIGKKYLRDIAKAIIFGILYGRTAKAIAMEARKEGVPLTVDDAQAVIDAIFAMYPKLRAFLDACERRALKQKCLTSPFGRHRRFPTSRSERMDGEFGRQAKNFPIQGLVADAVNMGLSHFDEGVRQYELSERIKLVLQVHDAGMAEVDVELVDYTRDLVKWSMIDSVGVIPCDLSGRPVSEEAYHFGADVTVYERWGEPLTAERCVQLGIDEKYAHG